MIGYVCNSAQEIAGMGWKETREKSRQVVHETFRIPAIYTPPGGGEPVNVRLRLHGMNRIFGDIEREGFAKVAEEVNQAIFDSVEAVPQKKGLIDFGVNNDFEPIVGSDSKFTIVNIFPEVGHRYIRTELTKKS